MEFVVLGMREAAAEHAFYLQNRTPLDTATWKTFIF
jgi:hypothetical protein